MANKLEGIEAKRQILLSEFHQYYFITLDTTMVSSDEVFINVVIPFEKILNTEDDYGLAHLLQYFNDDYSNILITNADNFNIIHQVECYQETFFIRLQPYTDKIALHILPKYYDATDNILFLKGEMPSEENINITPIYYHTHNDKQVNLYFTDKLGKDRDPAHKPYQEFDKFDDNPKLYCLYEDDEWVEEPYQNTYGEFLFDIRNRNVMNMQNVQINTAYKYNDSSPVNAIHYTGTKDITNADPIDRLSLIDANQDNITTKSNVIKQFELDDEDNIIFPTISTPVNNQTDQGFSHNSGLHSSNIGNLYHKTVKYINDGLYVEEFDGNDTQYMYHDWVDHHLSE